MKGLTVAFCLSVAAALPVAAQQRQPQQQPLHLLRGHIVTEQQGSPGSADDLSGEGTAPMPGEVGGGKLRVGNPLPATGRQKNARLRKIGHGLVGVARAVARVGDAVALEVLEAMLNSAPYVPPPPPASLPAGLGDTCVHGYTPSCCPYGYYGNSYGSPYLSGSGYMRMRPDYLGGYRFYTSTGAYGTLRPDYMGGYSMRARRF